MAEPVPEHRSSATLPLYLRVACALRDDLTHRRISPGSRLPSERLLAHRYHVNRQTVRSALQLLRDERLVVTDRRGTFAAVPGHEAAHESGPETGQQAAYEPRFPAREPRRRTFPGGPRAADALVRAALSWEAPPAALAGRLCLAPGEPTLVHRHLVLTPAGEPMQQSVTWFSRPALTEIPQLARYRGCHERRGQPDLRLLYHWMRQAGLRTTHRETVGVPAAPPHPAPDGARETGAARLSVHRVVCDQHGHALEITDIEFAARTGAWTYEFGG
ncbi:GntR family transcriptional regulator [Streptomyces sp. SKN60]|uniref:GntR family transcriptional regulator n=1 Tax=Streptomyces sp. SKN60 TaxID=2855506 RepID=UPI0022468CB7|nr:GntR family transcriptional regulator [Streptomyces sp. SKN60]MCX2181348.1 GntR family transcriptional regulator [Streptomyces sp. SKN60]